MPSHWKTNPIILDQSITSSVINNISTIPTTKHNITSTTTFLNTSLTALRTFEPEKTKADMGKNAVKDNTAIHVIETKVLEIETERKKLTLELEALRSENKWYRKKLSETETSLKSSEEKQDALKSTY